MTHADICRVVAKKCKVPEETARAVVESLISTTMDLLLEGDEAKIKGLGVFYSKSYHVPKMELEFGNKTKAGERRRIRFRPFDSTNSKLTERWKNGRP